ncbi:MAG: HPr family phosphocarrier protein [Chthoniobacterales bacterium]|nr:HPr family phosphocarrier protein [Chthoniobacterales bacterium]
MEKATAIVSSSSGVNVFLATRLANAVKHMRSIVLLKAGNRFADARNILSVVALCATLGSPIDIGAFGEDERDAAQAVEQILSEWSGNMEAGVVTKKVV